MWHTWWRNSLFLDLIIKDAHERFWCASSPPCDKAVRMRIYPQSVPDIMMSKSKFPWFDCSNKKWNSFSALFVSLEMNFAEKHFHRNLFLRKIIAMFGRILQIIWKSFSEVCYMKLMRNTFLRKKSRVQSHVPFSIAKDLGPANGKMRLAIRAQAWPLGTWSRAPGSWVPGAIICFENDL